MTDKAYETPLLELMRRVPKDVRAEWEIQWFDDGTPSGHSMAPVGLYLHRGADEIERLRAALERIAEYEDGGALAFIQIQRIVTEALHTQNGDVDTQSGDDDE